MAAAMDPVALQALADIGPAPLPWASIELDPPVPANCKILCVGTNYADHAAEMGSTAPEAHPVLFTRFPQSLVGDGQPIVRPAASERFDYEGELAVVVGRRMRNVSPTEAMGAVAGYSPFMDGSVRDFQRHTHQFTPGKNFDRSGAWGPWVTTADEVGDPSRLRVRTVVAGETLQDSSTSLLIHPIGDVLSYISTFTTLEPGDVVATGTPSGVGAGRSPRRWLVPGEQVEVIIDGVGHLRNRVVAEETS